MSEKPILGILLGNSAGVGPELVAMLAVKDYYADYCRPVIIGDLRMFEHGLKVVGGDVPHYVIDDLSQCDWSKGYPVLDLKDQDPDQVVYGEANAYCGAGDLKQLDTAIELCKAGKIEGIVFGPLHKGAMKMAGMHYESEHTYFAHAFDLKTPFCEVNMMDDLMTVRTTSHVPISEVSGMITVTMLMLLAIQRWRRPCKFRFILICTDAQLPSGQIPRCSGSPFIAVTPHGGDIVGILRVVLNFQPQAADIDIDYLLLAVVIAAPDGVEDIGAAQCRPGVCKEILHKLKFNLSQLYVDIVFGKRPVPEIQAELAELNDVVGHCRRAGIRHRHRLRQALYP